MVAEFKSHVLSRDEKGFMGVPFKRLMLAGVGGGMVYTLGKFALPDVAIPVALLVGVLLVILTAPRGGIPRWQRLLYSVRGSLMLGAAQQPHSLTGSVGKLVEIPTDLARLDSAMLFTPPATEIEANLAEWVTFAQAADADRGDGLEFVEVR
ncbi:MAG: hypothetical protein HS103_01400 [Anaerolineales bacterium]|nr:hypothetical protein [Anaerolineales bacterium]